MLSRFQLFLCLLSAPFRVFRGQSLSLELEMPYRDMLPEEALRRFEQADLVILDVRTHPEWHGGHIPGAVHIPLDELTARYQELDPEAETLVVCGHGIRSAAAGQWLASRAGFDSIANLRFGMSGWPGPVEPGE